MNRLSPNALFHFTPSIENLLGILDKTFYPRYCYDEFDLVDNGQMPFLEDAIPMVCFCDIPLSMLVNHIETYGNYGLGMIKEWGLRKGLNPVIYFNKNSSLANDFSLLTNGLVWEETPVAKAFHEIMFYLKPYSGSLYRGGKIVKEETRFYDEHEWRYVPNKEILNENGIEPSIQRHKYMNPPDLTKANQALERDSTRLTFEANDIKYIIIENENQISHMIEQLKSIKGARYDAGTVERLVSRIITVDQIKNDF